MIKVIDILQSKPKPLISVPPTYTIHQALQVMLKNKLGSIIIAEGDNVLGIWTERDLMRNTMNEQFSIHQAIIKDYMSTGLQSIDANASLDTLLGRFAAINNRHLLVSDNDKLIGVLSSGDAIRANLKERTQKYNELNSFVSWEYYEKWDR